MESLEIDRIKKRLLIKYPFFGSVIANTAFNSDNEIDTAATNGEEIIYNEQFINSLTEEEQIFVFAHEVCHISFNHIKRSEGKNERVWNIATDAVINALLKEDGLPLVDGVVSIEDVINYNAEEMYERLMKEYKDDINNSKGSNNSKVGHDSHEMWGRKNNKNKTKDNDQQTSSQGNMNKQKEIERNTEQGEKTTFKENKQKRKENIKKLREKISNQAGKGTNEDVLDVKKVDDASKFIDWRQVLRESITFDVDWSYANASIEEGVVTPHLEDMKKSEVEIVLDTSGSINQNMLRNFLRECKNIMQVSKVKVGCFDERFYGFSEIRNDRDIDNMRFRGGGGTDFNVAVNAFSKRVENKIIFTDGKALMPNKFVDAIWIVFGNEKINPSGGKVIYINEKQLSMLLNNTKRR